MPSLSMVNTRATLGLANVECHGVAGTTPDHGENGDPAGTWYRRRSFWSARILEHATVLDPAKAKPSVAAE
jgi:hypothetical protein